MIRVRAGAIALGTAVATLVLPGVALAQSESRLSADASVTAGYSNNPFTTTGSDTGAGVVTLDFAPRYQLLTARSTVTVSADANLQQYFSRYGHNENYLGAVDYQGRPSARVNTHARLDLSSSVLGGFNNYLPLAGLGGVTDSTAVGIVDAGAAGTTTTGAGTVALAPITSPVALTPYTDIGLFGLRNRRETARATGDLGFVLSARDSLTVSAFAEVARYHGLPAGDYQDFGGSVGYSRRLSDRVSVGLTGSAGYDDYRFSDADSRVYSVQATGSARLNSLWTASGAIGVSFVNSDTSRSTTSTSLSGNLNLCRRGPASSMCFQALRQVSPTGLAGSQYVTAAGLSWNRRLDERQNVSLSANYSRVGSGDTRLIGSALPLQTDYVQTVAGYDRRLGSRLRLVASASYRQLLGGGDRRPADVGGQLGLSYRLGDRR